MKLQSYRNCNLHAMINNISQWKLLRSWHLGVVAMNMSVEWTTVSSIRQNYNFAVHWMLELSALSPLLIRRTGKRLLSVLEQVWRFTDLVGTLVKKNIFQKKMELVLTNNSLTGRRITIGRRMSCWDCCRVVRWRWTLFRRTWTLGTSSTAFDGTRNRDICWPLATHLE